jgi:hypothetical protein
MDANVGRTVVRPSVVQRCYFLGVSAVFTAMLVVGIIMSLHAGSFAASKPAALGPALAFVGAFVVVYALPSILGRTVLTGDGISTTGALLIRRSCRWSELKKIETRQQSDSSGWITRVVVRRAHGRPIQLAAPWTGQIAVLRDPDFQVKLAQIIDYYTSVTGLAN